MRTAIRTAGPQAAALLTLAVITTGCGAIFNGTRQTITATSAPDQATISTEPGTGEFTTPASLSLERKNNYVLTFRREGYRPATFQVQKKLQGGIVVLDVLFTGLLGVIIDAATGAWYKLDPQTAVVSLTALTDGQEPATIDVQITRDGNALRIESSTPGVNVQVQRKR